MSQGIPEPTSEVVGTGMAGLVDAGCRVILAPALAIDRTGHRIGKAAATTTGCSPDSTTSILPCAPS